MNTIHGRHILPDIDTLGYIQCVTCGKMIGNLYEKADELRRKNFTEIEVYEKLGLKRTCCRFHLTLGIKMPMVKYLDENVRLDLIGTEEYSSSLDMKSHPEDITTNELKDVERDKVNSIKNRLSKLRAASNQVIGNNESIVGNISETKNTKKISMFVAT